MISWVKPQLLIPVHGEPLHLSEHAALARVAGVPHVLTCRNGDLIRLGPGPAEIIDELPHGRLYKDGLILEPESARAVSERRKLAYAGCVFVAFAMTDKGEMVDTPQVELLGVPEKDISGEDVAQNVYDVVVDTFAQLPRARKRDPDSVAESIRRAVRASVASGWGKKTICVVQVLTV
jgi:ribonuclease J